MTFEHQLGIIGYGTYIPRYRILLSEIAEVNGRDDNRGEFLFQERSAASQDEDAVTMGIEALKNAVCSAGISASELEGLWVGTESKPYAVKPCASIISTAIGSSCAMSAADIEFACKGGAEALRIALDYSKSKPKSIVAAIGTDSAQVHPDDPLFYTAAAAASSLIIGWGMSPIATIEAWTSYISDTNDFYRRDMSRYPHHFSRFTGDPSYFYHSENAFNLLLKNTSFTVSDIDHLVVHQPNPKFAQRLAARINIPTSKLTAFKTMNSIGNPYAANLLLGLSATLDKAKTGEIICCLSYGSGAGSDAIIIRVNKPQPTGSNGETSLDKYLSERILLRPYSYQFRK